MSDVLLVPRKEFRQLRTFCTYDGAAERLVPMQEFFTHIREARDFDAALVRWGKWNDVQVLARELFARSIEEGLQMASVQIEPAQRSAPGVRSGGRFLLAARLVDRQGNERGSQGNGRLVSTICVEGTGRPPETSY